ncbi:MAG: thiamine-phosphate kinase [Planctomycetota bacterium]
MTELEWIETFILPRTNRNSQHGILGPGDDAALLPIPAGETSVLTVDALVEGQHFLDHWLDDQTLARRLIRSSVSDLAAMGARPLGFLLSIETAVLPGRMAEAFWQSIDQECDQLGLTLLGGNVTRTEGPLSLHCNCIGSVTAGREWRRSGALAGDLLIVTGNPGMAAHARQQIHQGAHFDGQDCWSSPTPRLGFSAALARILAEDPSQRPPAAIDISDGLLLDLQRLCRANRCGANVDISPLTGGEKAPLVQQIISGGEDYELLLAIAPESLDRLKRAARETETPWHLLGTLEQRGSQQVELWNGNIKESTDNPGWDPFVTGQQQ